MAKKLPYFFFIFWGNDNGVVTLGSEEWPVVQSDYGALFSFVYEQLLN